MPVVVAKEILVPLVLLVVGVFFIFPPATPIQQGWIMAKEVTFEPDTIEQYTYGGPDAPTPVDGQTMKIVGEVNTPSPTQADFDFEALVTRVSGENRLSKLKVTSNTRTGEQQVIAEFYEGGALNVRKGFGGVVDAIRSWLNTYRR